MLTKLFSSLVALPRPPRCFLTLGRHWLVIISLMGAAHATPMSASAEGCGNQEAEHRARGHGQLGGGARSALTAAASFAALRLPVSIRLPKTA